MKEEENEETYYNLLVSFFAGGRTYLYDITKAKLVKILPTEELDKLTKSFVCDYSKEVRCVFINARLAEKDKENFRNINAEPENLEELLNNSFKEVKKITPIKYSLVLKERKLIELIVQISLMDTYMKLDLQELRN